MAFGLQLITPEGEMERKGIGGVLLVSLLIFSHLKLSLVHFLLSYSLQYGNISSPHRKELG